MRVDLDTAKEILKDKSVKYRVLELENDYFLMLKDDWVELECYVDKSEKPYIDTLLSGKKAIKIKSK